MNTHAEFSPTGHKTEMATGPHEQRLKQIREQQSNLLSRIEDPDIDTTVERTTFEPQGHTIYAQGDQVLHIGKNRVSAIPRSAVLFGGEWGIDFMIGPPEGKRPKEGTLNEPLVSLQRDFAVVEGNRRVQQIEFLNQAKQEVVKTHNKDMEEIAYQAMIDKAGKEDYELEPGELTEKMTRIALAKMAIDYNLPFRVYETSPFEDVEYKMDMLVEFKQGWNRGVEVEGKRNRLGVQLTAGESVLNREKKEKQIKHGVFQLKHQKSNAADDVVLVWLQINNEVRQAYDQWRKNQDGSYKNVQDCDPKGPEQFLSEETKRQMLVAVIDKLPPHLQSLTQQIISQVPGAQREDTAN